MSIVDLRLGIPVYNQANTIAETVKSALAQTEPFDEILVVDNHSTDGTSEILQSFSEKVRIISPPNHLSMVENWNYCVEQLGGTWFSLLSGDDLLKPEFAVVVRRAIAEHSDATVIRTDWENIDQHGRIIDSRRQISVARVTRPPQTWKEQLYGPKVSFAAFAARRDAWRNAGQFPADFHLFQDWMFWLKLAPSGSFIRVPECLAQYRLHDRPELEFKRAKPRLQDEYRYAMTVLPALPWGKTDASRSIRAVRRHRLFDLLVYLRRFPEASSDPESQQALLEWAEAAGMAHEYRLWREGKNFVSPFQRLNPIRLGRRIIRRMLSLCGL